MRSSPKRKVEFNLGEDEKKVSPPRQIDTTKQQDLEQKKLNMDPSSAVLDADAIRFAEDLDVGKLDSYMSP